MVTRNVARLFSKHFEIENPEAALKLVKALADNAAGLSADARKILESFPAFLSALEENYADAATELDEATGKLDDLNFAIEAILESLGQALLYFGPDGICAPIYSKACLTLLEAEPAGRHITDVLTPRRRASATTSCRCCPFYSPTMRRRMPFDELVALAARSGTGIPRG